MNIGRLIKNSARPFFSLEFFPPSKPEQLPDFYKEVETLQKLSPLFVSVTYGAGGSSQNRTLGVTSHLAKSGLVVMAHLTCVGASPASIREFIEQLLANNVDNILALRGDKPKDGEWQNGNAYFKNASDLVKFARDNFPDLGIGVAAYPAPHPESPTFAKDRQHTIAKLAAGADFAITQLFFDIREYIELTENIRKAGLAIPVIPGILPIQSLASLKRVLSLCGANIPGKLFLELEEIHENEGTQAVREAGFQFAVGQIRQLLEYGAPGIHLYTLNKSDLCSRLVQETGLA